MLTPEEIERHKFTLINLKAWLNYGPRSEEKLTRVDAIAAIDALLVLSAIEQQGAEPVGWFYRYAQDFPDGTPNCDFELGAKKPDGRDNWVPVYTHPTPPAQVEKAGWVLVPREADSAIANAIWEAINEHERRGGYLPPIGDYVWQQALAASLKE